MIQRALMYGSSWALHEDNRYLVSGQSGFFRRAKYAIRSTRLARHDKRVCSTATTERIPSSGWL